MAGSGKTRVLSRLAILLMEYKVLQTTVTYTALLSLYRQLIVQLDD